MSCRSLVCVCACSGLFGSNCESPDWPSQVRPAAPASGAARLLSTQVLFTVATAVTSRAWRTAALVGSGSASTLTLGASLSSKIPRSGASPRGLREGSHVLRPRCDGEVTGRLPLGTAPPLQVGSDVTSPERRLCASSEHCPHLPCFIHLLSPQGHLQ